MKEFHECPHCGGQGQIEVTGVYGETLRIARQIAGKNGQFIVANRDAEHFGCKPTALNNRLSVLEKYGKVFSERYGRQRRYYLTSVKG